MVAPGRKPWCGGNWKCNGSKAENAALVEGLNKPEAKDEVEVVVFPTALHIADVKASLGKNFHVGAQNVSATGKGAFTGEISAAMVKDFGLDYALVGHSERRSLYGESKEQTAAKTKACLAEGVNVAFCIGETLEQREAGETDKVCAEQLSALFAAGLQPEDYAKLVVAYEPVWAIGTGKVASPSQAQDAHKAIRALIKDKVSPSVAEKMRIVYGGSVSEKNCAELSQQCDIDGFLVGGASLKPNDFNTIIASLVNAASKN